MSREHLDHAVVPAEDAQAHAVLARVATLSGVPVVELLGKSRHAPIARARHVAVWAVRSQARTSYPSLGRIFGGRDHRTVMHSCQAVSRALEAQREGALATLARATVEYFEQEARGS